MGYAFISYSSKNRASADALRELLQRNGIATWMAPGDIPAGKLYAETITDALKNCACFVLILTEQSLRSKWVPKELERAVSYKKPIIPVKLEEIDLDEKFELYIGEYQLVSIDQIDDSTADMQRIIAGIKTHTNTGFPFSNPYPIANDPISPAESSSLIKGKALLAVGDIIEFGHYYIDDEDEMLPIKWRVLHIKNNKALLISCDCLDSKPFNVDARTNLWKDCTLRKWMNEDFYHTAFSNEEKSIILKSSIFTERSGKTSDNVFLLSREQTQTYFHSDNARCCKPTEYAKGNGVYPSTNPNCVGNCWWWIRTSSGNPKHACFIAYDGSARNYTYVMDDSPGIRPAINISVDLFTGQKDNSIQPEPSY